MFIGTIWLKDAEISNNRCILSILRKIHNIKYEDPLYISWKSFVGCEFHKRWENTEVSHLHKVIGGYLLLDWKFTLSLSLQCNEIVWIRCVFVLCGAHPAGNTRIMVTSSKNNLFRKWEERGSAGVNGETGFIFSFAWMYTISLVGNLWYFIRAVADSVRQALLSYFNPARKKKNYLKNRCPSTITQNLE